jgi:hypothetical protein
MASRSRARGPLSLQAAHEIALSSSVNYCVASIEVAPGKIHAAVAGLEKSLCSKQFEGKLCACWHSEIGRLNRVLVIWSSPIGGDPDVDQIRTAGSDFFGVADIATSVAFDVYATFPEWMYCAQDP